MDCPTHFQKFGVRSNLLMGEFERSGMGQRRGLAWAIEDVFNAANLKIAMVAALVGYILLEFLRKQFQRCQCGE
jgi:hypothetical protein